jgi:hypothetical protein
MTSARKGSRKCEFRMSNATECSEADGSYVGLGHSKLSVGFQSPDVDFAGVFDAIAGERFGFLLRFGLGQR